MTLVHIKTAETSLSLLYIKAIWLCLNHLLDNLGGQHSPERPPGCPPACSSGGVPVVASFGSNPGAQKSNSKGLMFTISAVYPGYLVLSQSPSGQIWRPTQPRTTSRLSTSMLFQRLAKCGQLWEPSRSNLAHFTKAQS